MGEHEKRKSNRAIKNCDFTVCGNTFDIHNVWIEKMKLDSQVDIMNVKARKIAVS